MIKQVSFIEKILIFIFQSVNVIVNLLLFIIICISARNIKLLKPYQALYLVLSIIIWLIINLYCIAKLVFLIVYRIKKKEYLVPDLEKLIFIAKLNWLIVFGIAFSFMFIGFIYDIAMIIKEKIATIIYPFIYFIVCFFYVILSYFDYYFCEKSLNLIFRQMEHRPQESDVKLYQKENETQEDEKHENVKEKDKQDLLKEKNE